MILRVCFSQTPFANFFLGILSAGYDWSCCLWTLNSFKTYEHWTFQHLTACHGWPCWPKGYVNGDDTDNDYNGDNDDNDDTDDYYNDDNDDTDDD